MSASELRRRMGVTSGSRFNAARRLAKIDKSFNFVLSMVSVGIIALTVLPFIFPVTDENERIIAFFTIAASVAILVLTNLNGVNQNLVIAEQLHRCALEISEVSRDIDIALSKGAIDDYTSYSTRYSDILQKYSVNHDKVDYVEHKLHRRDEYKSEFGGWLGEIKAIWLSWVVWQNQNRVWIVALGVFIIVALVLARMIHISQ